MSKKLIKKTDSSIVEYEAQKTLPIKLKESITNALANITEEKALILISQSLEGDAIRKKAEAIINKETIYVAKIPRKLDGAFDAGLFDFMTDSKTGESTIILWFTVKIYIPTLWPDVFGICTENELEYDMAKNILPVSVDQRYDVNDMKYIVEEICKCLELMS